jgi:hypothetical protein
MSNFGYIGYKDTLGGAHGFINNAGAPQICSQDYLLALAEGDIPGHSTWLKIGYNHAIGTTEEDMWVPGTPYIFMTGSGRLWVASTHAQDYKSGLGVQEVRVRYLDRGYNQRSETITMSGTTLVPSAGSEFYRINSFRATYCGASGVALGNITIGSGTNYYSYIGSTFTRARNVIYTVPSGQTLYITSLAYSSATLNVTKPEDTRFTLKATYDDLGSQMNFFMAQQEVLLIDGAYTKTLEIPIKMPATTDLKVSAIASAAGNKGTCTLRGWIE